MVTRELVPAVEGDGINVRFSDGYGFAFKWNVEALHGFVELHHWKWGAVGSAGQERIRRQEAITALLVHRRQMEMN